MRLALSGPTTLRKRKGAPRGERQCSASSAARESGRPLADLKEAKRIVAALPAGEAFASLEEIAHWLESSAPRPTSSPSIAPSVVQLLDEAGQAHARKLSREYLAAARQGKQRGAADSGRRYTPSSSNGARLRDLPRRVRDGRQGRRRAQGLARRSSACARLRALAQQLKWLQFRYGPLDERFWTMMSRIYALLESKKLARTQVVPYPGLGAGLDRGARVPARGHVQRVLARTACCRRRSRSPSG